MLLSNKIRKSNENSNNIVSLVTHLTLGVSSLNACIGSAFELPVVVVESARIWLPLSPQVEPFFSLKPWPKEQV